MSQIVHIDGPETFARCFNVSRETITRLETYAELLRKWQKAVNLVAHSTLDELWHRHIGDSAQIVDIVKHSDSPKKGGIWLDIGCGSGFPGLVAAIMLFEDFDYRFHLVESNGRKCAFLSDVVRHLALPVEIHNLRIEQLAHDGSIGTADIVSARALASLDKLLELSDPFVGKDTVAYYFKGREVESELDKAREQWAFRSRQIDSRTSEDGRILELTELQRK